MTDEQIITLVQEHFTEEWCEEDGNGWVEFSGKPSAFLKFAQAIRAQSFADGYDLAVMDYIRGESYFTTRTASND